MEQGTSMANRTRGPGVASLRGLELLREVSDETLQELLCRAEQITLRRGQYLVRRDEANTRIYIVLSGLLRVELGEAADATIARIGPGETVGELSLLARRPVSATVVAEASTRLLAIDEQSFHWLIRASHGFAVSLLTRMAERLRANNETVQTNIEQRREFEHAALHDALTGVHSRRWFEQALPRIVQRHVFASDPLAIAVLDVDHFKRVNDRFGHPAGDSVLAEVAVLLREKVRPTDLIARFGGEEFVVIFPQTPMWGALRAAERVREAIAAAPMQHEGVALPAVTVSLGVSALGTLADPRKLLAEADQALYQAKSMGRNRTQAYAPVTS